MLLAAYGRGPRQNRTRVLCAFFEWSHVPSRPTERLERETRVSVRVLRGSSIVSICVSSVACISVHAASTTIRRRTGLSQQATMPNFFIFILLVQSTEQSHISELSISHTKLYAVAAPKTCVDVRFEVRGTSMGIKICTNYANISVGQLENEFGSTRELKPYY